MISISLISVFSTLQVKIAQMFSFNLNFFAPECSAETPYITKWIGYLVPCAKKLQEWKCHCWVAYNCKMIQNPRCASWNQMIDLSDTHGLAKKDSEKKIPMDSSTQVIPYFMIMPLSAAYVMACISTLPGLGPEARWNRVRLKRGFIGGPLGSRYVEAKATKRQLLTNAWARCICMVLLALLLSSTRNSQQVKHRKTQRSEVDLRFVGFLLGVDCAVMLGRPGNVFFAETTRRTLKRIVWRILLPRKPTWQLKIRHLW